MNFVNRYRFAQLTYLSLRRTSAPSQHARRDECSPIWIIYSRCQKNYPNSPGNRLFEKSRFSGPFRQKLLTYSEIMLAIFRSLSAVPHCNKVPEEGKTSGTRCIYSYSEQRMQDILRSRKRQPRMCRVPTHREVAVRRST